MRLLCIYQHAPTPGAPGIYRHRRLLAELASRGWYVDLVSTPINYMTGLVPDPYQGRAYRRETIDGVVHHWVWASGGIHASIRRRAANYATFAAAAGLRGATLPRPDVVLASSPPLPVGTLGELVARRHRVPWLVEVRDPWPESAASVGWIRRDSRLYRVLDRLATRATKQATGVVVTSPGLVELMERRGGREITVVTDSVVEIPVDHDTRTRVRCELGAHDGRCVFLYLGAHGAANGLDLLLDAVAALPHDVDASVVLAGDGGERVRLAERVARDGLAERVRLLGPVPKERAQDLLAASDVGLHLLRADSLFAYPVPTKMLEYLGSRRPVVTTVPGIPERLALESGGAFAPSATALASELERWSAMTPDERAERGERSLLYGIKGFGLQANADRLEAALLRAVDRKAGTRSP